jgi:hypothetical protein
MTGVVCVMFAIFVPIVCFSWLTRWRTLGWELVRPVRRRAFVTEMGTAMAIDLVELLAATFVGSIVPVLVWRVRIGWDFLLPYGMTIAAAALNFGVNIEVLRFRRAKLAAITLIVMAWAPFLAWLPVRNTVGMLLVMLGMILVGVMLALDARRRWTRTDLA